ncbi:SEP-domain-containing protein [Obelidium mucronatum]|nr:SEP-domain-containing protein [Obelidium mucronatum]
MSNIRGLNDLNNNNHGGGDSSDEDESGQQEYFAGGEKSGVAVQGPRTTANPNAAGGSANPADLIRDILGKAAKGTGDAKQQDSKKPVAFTGSGYRLGAENEPAPPPVATAAVPQPPAEQEPELELVTRHLTFWADGFTVENGPLMRYSDPGNQEILQAINSGRAPVQLLNVLPGQQVDVRVARVQEAWSEAAAKKLAASIAAAGDGGSKKAAGTPAFTGAGHRLGGESSAGASSSSTSGGMPGGFPSSALSSSSSSAPVTAAPPSFTLDASLPVTSLQIRLADGTRMVAKMNHTHTVGDVRGFINASRTGESSRPYAIMTTFPNKDLTDDSVTLKEAGLINAVIVQRLL